MVGWMRTNEINTDSLWLSIRDISNKSTHPKWITGKSMLFPVTPEYGYSLPVPWQDKIDSNLKWNWMNGERGGEGEGDTWDENEGMGGMSLFPIWSTSNLNDNNREGIVFADLVYRWISLCEWPSFNGFFQFGFVTGRGKKKMMEKWHGHRKMRPTIR